LKDAYEKIESEFLQIARTAYDLGFPSVARVGACALTAVIIGSRLYSANLGDCKGVIINIDEKGNSSFRKINHMLNANSKKE
jgi:pyruvate dehydrogenase phosphatase